MIVKKNNNLIKCYGCGAMVDNITGNPHDYIGTVQGCWNLYGQILAKEYLKYNDLEMTHRLTVDTYAVQHPGHPNRRSIQSVNIHLISLYYIIVKNIDEKYVTKLLNKILSKKPIFKWLDPPEPNGLKTIIDVLKAKNIEEHKIYVKEWAEDVWNYWYNKHGEIIKNNVNKNYDI